jgi:hypothetical protein
MLYVNYPVLITKTHLIFVAIDGSSVREQSLSASKYPGLKEYCAEEDLNTEDLLILMPILKKHNFYKDLLDT